MLTVNQTYDSDINTLNLNERNGIITRHGRTLRNKDRTLMDLSNSYDTEFKTPSYCKIYLTDRHAKLTPRYSREPNNLNLYYPLPRKSGSTNLSFPAQMCNLSNSDQKECMGIALHHAGNKDIYLQERNFTFCAKI